MLDDFFTRAMIAGIGVAAVAGPLGCFIVWRRLAYFGDTLAHAGLLGVAIGILLDVNLTVGVFLVSALVAMALLVFQRRSPISSDAILGLLSHSSLAIGLVVLSFMTWVRLDIMGLLFGDVLSVSRLDIATIWIGGALVLAVLVLNWRSFFATTVNSELAEAEGINPDKANLLLLLLTAAVIAIAMKIVGVLLITALLIIPAATARSLSSGPEQMALFAALSGILAVVIGLYSSLQWDTPSGPSIVLAALFLFLLSLSPLVSLLTSLRGSKAQED